MSLSQVPGLKGCATVSGQQALLKCSLHLYWDHAYTNHEIHELMPRAKKFRKGFPIKYGIVEETHTSFV